MLFRGRLARRGYGVWNHCSFRAKDLGGLRSWVGDIITILRDARRASAADG
jgi:hypothetical protein